MSSDYGHCKYCGKYRPLKYGDGYCSQRCYKFSGAQASDEQAAAEYAAYQESITWHRDDIVAILLRIVSWTIGWIVFMVAMAMFKVPLFQWVVLSRGVIFMIVVGAVISAVQNIVTIGKSKSFRQIVAYGPPVVLAVLFIFVVPKFTERHAMVAAAKASPLTGNTYGDKKKSYALEFKKDGTVQIFDAGKKDELYDSYEWDEKSKTITLDGYSYVYTDIGLYEKDDKTEWYVKADAKFDATSAADIIGKSYSFNGKTISFADNGTVTLAGKKGNYLVDSDSHTILVYLDNMFSPDVAVYDPNTVKNEITLLEGGEKITLKRAN